ncbi:MAG TPA: orotidine-5'-phosphate decarboxylase [Alphaproteobacteria bacterium]|nr:orotidine-5'-phosphate decarboxylase [Alphaproteobacteria bacterium]
MSAESTLKPAERIFVALDLTDLERASALARELKGAIGGIKIGLELFSARGVEAVRELRAEGLPLFLDLKLHDIPNTVASAVRALLPLEPALLTLHASGGPAMLRAAAAAAQTAGPRRPRLLAVTVLTSLDERDLRGVGQEGPIAAQVLRLAELAQGAGIDGVVCSPQEVAALRANCGPGFILAVPGIRPAWAQADDQKRVTTPKEALAAGADYLVIGRPITQAPSPRAAAARIVAELAGP